jgi:hypothetical protein
VTRQLSRARRNERIGGIILATLGVGVAIIAVIALRNPNGHGASASDPTHTATSSPSKTPASPGKSTPHATKSGSPKLALVVLNDTGVSGQGDQAAAQFRQGGWTVTSSADYQNDILSTCAYYDPADPRAKPAAEALQQQFPAIKRVVPKFPELPAGPIVVVLTPDYTSG